MKNATDVDVMSALKTVNNLDVINPILKNIAYLTRNESF